LKHVPRPSGPARSSLRTRSARGRRPRSPRPVPPGRSA